MPAHQLTTKQANILARNRANAQRSTGPRTVAGKVRASRNALTHGLTAQGPVDAAEVADRAARAALLAEVLAPEDALEEALVERVAAAFQRLEKADHLESQVFESSTISRPETPGAILKNSDRCRHSFEVLNRYRATAAGELHHTLKLLEALRHLRRKDESAITKRTQNAVFASDLSAL